MKPGELQSGGYGFYYKGGQPEQPVQPRDVLQDLQAAITPMVSRPRSQEPARPYRELVASPVYFSNEKWSECLASHGLIVDAENRTLTVQSENVNADMVYDLTEEEIKTLTSNSLEEHSIEQRLELLNGVIAGDFADKVTLDDLNSDRHIAIGLHPEVHEELAARHYQEYALANGQTEDYGNSLQLSDEIGGHGTEISRIAVEPGSEEGKYRMTAVIDGLVFRNVEMRGVKAPFVINMFYFCDPDGHGPYVQCRDAMPVDEYTPKLGSLTMEDIVATDAQFAGCYFDGLPEQPIERVSMKNVTITFDPNAEAGQAAMADNRPLVKKLAIYAENVKEIDLHNVKIEGYEGERLHFANVGHFEED